MYLTDFEVSISILVDNLEFFILLIINKRNKVGPTYQIQSMFPIEKRQFIVVRNYSDFLVFFNFLSLNNPGIII